MYFSSVFQEKGLESRLGRIRADNNIRRMMRILERKRAFYHDHWHLSLAKKYWLGKLFERRIGKELEKLRNDPLPDIRVQKSLISGSFTDKTCRIYFVIRGHKESPYNGGYYIGWIQLYEKFPFVPPDIGVCVKNGRFKKGRRICLSLTSYHKETWSPSNSLSTVLLSFQSFWLDDKEGRPDTYGAVDARKAAKKRNLTVEEYRRKFARDSVTNSLNRTILGSKFQEYLKLTDDDRQVEDNGGIISEERLRELTTDAFERLF